MPSFREEQSCGTCKWFYEEDDAGVCGFDEAHDTPFEMDHGSGKDCLVWEKKDGC